jgi:hypothetical protein
MGARRPWRAVASWHLGDGRLYAGRAAAQTREALDRFIAEREALGQHVVVWQVQPIPAVEALVTQHEPSEAR